MNGQLCLGHLCRHPDFIFLDDPIFHESYDKRYAELSGKLKPLMGAIKDSRRLTAKDYSLTVNS